MPESVATGGLKQFRYPKGNVIRASQEQREEIEEAYTRADERKSHERKNRTIMWVIIALIVVLIVGGYLLFR